MTETADDRTVNAPQPNHRGLVWMLTGILAAIVIIPVLVLGWLGLVPGVSDLMGARQARDLGVQYSTVDVQSYETKSGARFEDPAAAPEQPARPGRKKVFDQPRRVETRFTQEELSAMLNSAALKWLPLKDVQVRLKEQTMEVSGLLGKERVPELLNQASRLGYTESDLARVAAYAEKIPGDIPLYVKVAGAVKDSQLDLQLQAVEIGRFALPADLVTKIAPNGIRSTIKSSETFAVETATPRDGGLDFTGTLPTRIYLGRR